jgi:hypothetical protein
MNNIEMQGGGKRFSTSFIALGVGVSILLVVASFFLGRYVANQSANDSTELSADVDVLEQVEEEKEVEEPFLIDHGETQVVAGNKSLNIDWYDQAQQIDMHPILKETYRSHYSDQNAIDEELGISFAAFELGKITSGEYEGYELTYQISSSQGMAGPYYDILYLLSSESDGVPAVILDRYASMIGSFRGIVTSKSAREVLSDQELLVIGERILFDTGAVVAEFEFTDKVGDQEGNQFNFYSWGHRADYPGDINVEDFEIHGTLENGVALYAINDNEDLASYRNLFFSVAFDDRIVIYDIDLPMWPEGVEVIEQMNVRWSDGSYNAANYAKGKVGGCGYFPVTNVIKESDLPELQEAGTVSSTAEVVYEPVSLDTQEYQSGFAAWSLSNEDSTIDDFASIHPYTFYKDSLGRWIQLTNVDVTGGAECGKPVIYLYPEEKTDIEVKLYPQGGFSVTEPAYNDGWNVAAYPDGRLLNHGDGNEYPYLFWEGRGGAYMFPNRYWVVAGDDVESFLIETLGEIGLNAQEIADFNEFWLPKMQSASYYQVGFHGTNAMDMIAPMELSVQPDSVLRVLMDYQELEVPIKENPPMIRPFNRDGFTVVEWGGVLK